MKMEKQEFDQRLKVIEGLLSQAAGPRDQYISRIKELYNSLNSLIVNLDNRDTKFIEYLNDISGLSFSDTLKTPTDLFQGIRPAKEMTDYVELAATGNRMQATANEIEGYATVSSSGLRNSIEILKMALIELDQLAKIKNEIYDKELKLLDDMDSIYNIGGISGSDVTEYISKNS